MSNEIWKDIKDYEGLYQVSNLGNVRSLDRFVYDFNSNNKSKRFKKGKLLKVRQTGKKYLSAFLSKNNILKKFFVHRLVAEHFIDKNNFKCMPSENRENIKLDDLYINHIDENPLNNKANNLEWCTITYNNNYGTRKEKFNNTISKRKLVIKNENI